MNILAPTAGTATVLGVDSRRLGPAQFRRIGYVSENQELPGWMTIRELLAYCAPFYPTWDRAFTDDLRKRLDLPAQPANQGVLSRHADEGGAAVVARLPAKAARPR